MQNLSRPTCNKHSKFFPSWPAASYIATELTVELLVYSWPDVAAQFPLLFGYKATTNFRPWHQQRWAATEVEEQQLIHERVHRRMYTPP